MNTVISTSDKHLKKTERDDMIEITYIGQEGPFVPRSKQ